MSRKLAVWTNRYMSMSRRRATVNHDVLSFSKSDNPLSTLRLSFAHFAKWSCALVCISSFFVVRISVFSFFCCATFAE